MVIQYKCQNCGADMGFDTKSGKLKCQSCGHEESIEQYNQNNIKDETIYEDLKNNEVNQYKCQNCGASIITEKNTTATNCSFCGAAVILGDRLQGIYSPIEVIPFKISKDEAQAAFKKWCNKSFFTPKKFKSANRIKSITGIYVPFWLFNLNVSGDILAQGTKVRTYDKGNYIYTETKYYDLYRTIDLDYIKVPADASEKMDDKVMDKLEPFDYGELKKFKPPYLANYIAESYNYTDKQLLSRVKQRVSKYADNFILNTTIEYSSVNFKYKNLKTIQKKAEYVLLPVWAMTYDYEHSEYMFAMNGQTGKVVGKPPISKSKVAITYIVLSLILTLICRLIWQIF